MLGSTSLPTGRGTAYRVISCDVMAAIMEHPRANHVLRTVEMGEWSIFQIQAIKV